MSTERFRHKLMDVFLAEQFGGKAPPDMSREILSRAAGGPARAGHVAGRGGRFAPAGARRGWELAAATAATFLIAAVVWRLATLQPYPQPTASGRYSVIAGDAVRRGARIRTGSGSAVLELGGYCRVTLQPDTTLRIGGRKRAEEIFLETGTAVCRIDRNVGGFVVRAELGTVTVTGTEFTVRVAQVDGGRSMWVGVAAGRVEVRDDSGSEVLLAGQEWRVEDVPDVPSTRPGETRPPASEGAKGGAAPDGDVRSEADNDARRPGGVSGLRGRRGGTG